MFKHFLRIASRNLLKRKFYSFINIAGLAIGMACCLLIALYIKHELSFDRYHDNHERIYRVLQTYRAVEKGQKPIAPAPQDYQVWGCAPVGPALQADFPEVEQIAQMMSPISLLLQTGDKRIQQDNLICADSTVFKVFSWKLLQGDPRTALTAPYSIVLTEETAHKLFGNANAVGQTLRANNQGNFMVTGVVQNVPSNSQVTFNGLISMSTAHDWQRDVFSMWGYVDFYTYVLLKKNARIEPIQAGAAAFVKRHNPDDPGYNIAFEPLDDAYLHSKAQRQPGPVGSMLNIYLFSCIGVIILLIACVNFMNLSTARSLERAKEVGVRKVLGVTPSALRRQFLLESFIIALVAGIAAVLFTKLALPLVSELSGKAFAPHTLFSGHFVWWVILLIIITGLLAGTYPAWFLSRFRPVAVLKGTVRPSRGSMSLRKALVVFQFTLSVTLIAGTIIVYAELRYLNNHDLGFKKDQMLVINFEGDKQVAQNIEAIKHAIANQPGVGSVGASRAVPGDFLPNAGTNIETANGTMMNKNPLIYEVDFDFIPTLQIPMAAGRNYSRNFLTDSTQALLINEATARLYGYRNPADAVGKKFAQWGRQGTIIGVVKDFHFRSLHTKVEPLTLRYGMFWSLNRIVVSVKGNNVASTLAAIEKT